MDIFILTFENIYDIICNVKSTLVEEVFCDRRICGRNHVGARSNNVDRLGSPLVWDRTALVFFGGKLNEKSWNHNGK